MVFKPNRTDNLPYYADGKTKLRFNELVNICARHLHFLDRKWDNERYNPPKEEEEGPVNPINVKERSTKHEGHHVIAMHKTSLILFHT